LEPAANIKIVRRKLADGSVRIHLYDQKTREKLTAEEAEKRTKMATAVATGGRTMTGKNE
jgi:hypothetical protein